MHYKHLSQEERYHIRRLMDMGKSLRQVSFALGRSVSTVSRELRRNRPHKTRYTKDLATVYDPGGAQDMARRRRRRASCRPRLSPHLWDQVLTLISEQQWSPRQISDHLARQGQWVSAEAIYRRLYALAAKGDRTWTHLRHRRRQRLAQKRLPRALRQHRQRYGGKTLVDRPEVSSPDHYEIDTIVGGGSMVLVALERHSRKVFISKCANRSASETSLRLKGLLSGFPIKTITTDNGTEFSGWQQIERELHCEVYYTDPHAPWQKGAIENANGLIRQYLPKGCDVARATSWQLQEIAVKMNTRPRKCLGGKTPEEVFSGNLNRVALQS